MKCPKCGAECVPAEKQCWQCYTLLVGPAASQAAPPPSPTAHPPTRRAQPKVLMPAVILAVIILAAAGAWYGYSHTGARGCARAFCAAIDGQDMKALQALLASKDRQLMGPAVAAGMSAGRKFSGFATKSKVESLRVTGDTAEAIIKITPRGREGGNSGASTTMPLAMVKEADGWRVDFMATMRKQFEALGLSPDALKLPENLTPPATR